MDFKTFKISDGEFEGKGISQLPKYPSLRTPQMQQKFDELVKDVVAPHLNDLCDALGSAAGAEIEQVLSGSADILPSSRAVADAIAVSGGGDMMRAVYDQNLSGVVDDAEALCGHSADYFATAAALQQTASAAAAAMPKAGGSFSGSVSAAAEACSLAVVRNIAVQSADNQPAATSSILMVRK